MTKKFNEVFNRLNYETNNELDWGHGAFHNSAHNGKLILKEGLIRSYGVEKLVNSLLKIKGVIEIKPWPNQLQKYSKDGLIRVTIDPNMDLDKFSKKLDTYGYFIGKTITPTTLDLGAKFPNILNVRNWPSVFYHVAPRGLATKIQKIGLVPHSSSRRDFTYNQNRIYLFYSPNIAHLSQLSFELFKSSIDSLDTKNEYDKHIKYRASSENDYVWFKVNSSNLDYHDLYLDPQFNSTKGIVSVFTLRNIHPNSLKIIN